MTYNLYHDKITSAGDETFEEAINRWHTSVNNGNVDAQRNLGLLYANGHGVPKDINRAFRYFSSAYEQGDIEAEKHLSKCYFDGHGTPIDEIKGLELLVDSAENGFHVAQYHLGTRHLKGRQIPLNYQASFYWTSRAAVQGDEPALYNLAVHYFNGYGCSESPRESYRSLMKMRPFCQELASVADKLRKHLTCLPEAERDEIEKDVKSWEPVPETYLRNLIMGGNTRFFAVDFPTELYRIGG